MRRRRRGDETTQRLLSWSDSSKAAERLAAHILTMEGFTSIDPAHPLGGPDGLADLICTRENKRWVVGVHFPRGEKPFASVLKKFKSDLPMESRNTKVDGFAFVTNQYLTKAKRTRLVRAGKPVDVEVLHLERIARLLDSPASYGVRLEFLDIKMTKEEQLAFFASMAQQAAGLNAALATLKQAVPAADFPKLREALKDLEQYEVRIRGLVGGWTGGAIGQLYPPLNALKEYEERVRGLVGGLTGGAIGQLYPPLNALKEYEERLDRVVEKGRTLRESHKKIGS